MLDESPKLLFMHWTVTGNPDEIVQQAKEAKCKHQVILHRLLLMPQMQLDLVLQAQQDLN